MKYLALFVPCLLSISAPARGEKILLPQAASATPAQQAYNRGVALLNAQKIDAAEVEFRQSLQAEREFALAWVGLADVALKRKSLSEAESGLATAVRLAPEHPGIREALGRFLASRNKDTEAEGQLRKAVDLGSQSAGVRILLGDLAVRHSRDAEQGIQWYRQGLAIDPKHAGGHFALGSALRMSNRPDEALKEFQEAARLAPSNPLPLQATGELLMQKGDSQGALRAFDAALARQADFVLAYLSKGDVYASLKQSSMSMAAYAKAVELAPQAPLARLRLAQLFHRSGRGDDALTEYQQAVRLDPQLAVAWNNMADLSLQKRLDLPRALDWARRAVKLDPRRPEYQATLKDVQLALTAKKNAPVAR